MSLRDQEYREICTHPDCDTWSTDPCLRCGRPLCQEHKSATAIRCEDCECEFDRLVAQAPSYAAMQIMIGLLALVGYVCSIATGILNSGFALLLGLFVVPLTAGVLLEVFSTANRRRTYLRRIRSKFLAERKHPELLPGNGLPGSAPSQLAKE